MPELDGLALKQSLKQLEEFGLLEDAHKIAMTHGATMSEILGGDRSRHVTVARKEIAALIKQRYPLWSSTKIGKILKRDHSTVVQWRTKA